MKRHPLLFGTRECGDIDEREDQSARHAVDIKVRHHAPQIDIAAGSQDALLDRGARRGDLGNVFKDIIVFDPRSDVANVALDVRSDQVEQLGGSRSEEANLHLSVEKNRPNLGRLDQVAEISTHPVEIFDPLLMLGVDRVELLIDRVQLLIGTLQLLIGGKQLLVGGLQLLIARFKLFDRRL